MPVKIEWYSMYHTCLKDPFLAILVQITTAWTEPVFCKSHHLGIVYPETLLGPFMTLSMTHVCRLLLYFILSLVFLGHLL